MIEATQRKLREAQFFLDQLVREGGSPVRKEPETFSYYLSALLSAARSITFALQYEEKDKYDAWFPTWLANRTEKEQSLLNLLKNQRNYEQKRGGADVAVAWDYVPLTRMLPGGAGQPTYGFNWFAPPGTPPPLFGVPVYSFKSTGDEQEVTKTCREYVDMLAELVRDFIDAHKPEGRP